MTHERRALELLFQAIGKVESREELGRLSATAGDLYRGHDETLQALIRAVAVRSGHVVQSPDGQPAVVVRAVRAVVRAVRDGTRLPPCPQLYAALAVRCAR